jgi:tetratricopeptide (TPR) repeat protein
MRVAALHELLSHQLDNPAAALDVLVTSLAKGEQHLELWEALHEAAVRDEVTADLALAYDKVTRDKRIKLLAARDRALLLLYAARFFGEILGDADGAVAFARQLLEVVPNDPEGFALLERTLASQRDRVGLARLYAAAAANEAEADRQLEWLGQAAEQVRLVPDADDVAIDIYRRMLQADPGNAQAVDALPARLARAGRHREAARLLEETLRQAAQTETVDLLPIRGRLLELYARELGEPHRAILHVEALLAAQPDHEAAVAVAEGLLEHPAVAARAAAALSDAYQKLGRLANAADMLTLELKIVRGPRRIEVQRRLAILRQDVLGDPAGALELLGPAVAGDPGDDELRRRFVELSVSLDQPREAARMLERALRSARDPAIRARVGVEVGALYRKLGDVKRAEETLQKVISTGSDERATLGAARHLAELYSDAGDLRQLAGALELVVRYEPQAEPRHQAARRLARLCEEGVAEAALAVPAWEALVDSPWADQALGKLEPLYEKAANHTKLADVLARRARRAKDPAQARELAFRAAELQSTHISDRAAALEAWRAVVATYGPSREAHARLLPLLEQERQWEEAASVLSREIELAPAEQRPALLARLAQLRLSRLNDVAGALAAFRDALREDRAERTSRVAVEKLLCSGEARLEAADILEPLYRQEGAAAGLVRVLETRGELSGDAQQRLAALTEAVAIAQTELQDVPLAIRLGGQALAHAVAYQRTELPHWLGRVQELGATGADPTTRGQILAEALGAHEVDSQQMLALACAAGEALVLAGDLDRAIAAYRRALAFVPSSPELLARIDDLLAQQGSPGERLALYQAALGQPCEPARRRELLHAMGALQRTQLGDLQGAIATWQTALREDPGDQTAQQALLDAYAEQQDWQALYGQLEQMLEQHTGGRRTALLRRMAEVKAQQGEPEQALAHYRELLAAGEQPEDVLRGAEALARQLGDAEMVRDVLEQRILSTADPDEQAELLEELGRVQALDLGDADQAARSWRRGARLSESVAANDERALRLYERVLHVSPQDPEAAQRLIELYARAGAWDRIPAAFEVVLSTADDDMEAVAQLLGLEQAAMQAGAAEIFVKLLDAALALQQLAPDQARQLSLAKARALAASPVGHAAAARIYRELLAVDSSDSQAVADAFEAFLEQRGLDPELLEHRRWLLAWRADNATDAIAALMRWAQAEERVFSNPQAALELYARVLDQDPDRTDALSELGRIQAELGDFEGALVALRALRDRSDEQERVGIDLKVATLLLEQLERPDEALAVAESLLELSPTDPSALAIVNRTLAYPETKMRAAQLLERASEAVEDPRRRAEVLETLLSMSVGLGELEPARRRWYRRLLDASDDDPAAALDIALRGARQYTDAEELWDAAERFARRLDQPGPVAEAYAQALDQQLSPEAAEALGRRIVEFHEEWFDQPDQVIALLRRVVDLCPSAGWAFDRLKLAYNAVGRWEELFDLYDQTLGRAGDDDEQAELLREAAMAAKDFAADPDRAIGYLERYNGLCPGDSRIESSLERLYEREGRVRPLIALLSGRLESAAADDRVALQARIASLWLDIDEPAAALQLLQAALEVEATTEVVGLLERIIALPAAREALARTSDAAEPSGLRVRDVAADHLQAYYRSVGQTADVARVLQVRLQSVTDAVERVERLTQLVELRLEQLDDAIGAFANVMALVRLQPAEAKHRELLRQLAERIDAQQRRAELLIEVAEATDESALQAQLLHEAASVYQELLAQPDRAIELYLRVLELAYQQQQSLALDAARRLDGLLALARLADQRCTVLEQRAALETDARARRTALGNAANVAADALGDLDRAIRNWRQRLDDDEQDLEALDGLCATLERAERLVELIAALGARAALVTDPEQTRRDLVQIARIHAERLEDRPAAIEAWRAVRQRTGPDQESFDALAALLRAEQRYNALAALLLEEANAAQDAQRRVVLFRLLGDLHRDKTGKPERALQAYVSAGDWERAVQVAGADGLATDVALQVRRDLLDLAVQAWQRGQQPEAAARAADWALDALADKLREVGNHEQVVSLLLHGSELALPVERKRELRRAAACICSDQLSDNERAIDIFRELLDENPSDAVAADSVTRFASLLERAGLFAELVDLWEQQADVRAQAGDASSAAALWARAGELCETKLNDEGGAIRAYRRGAGLGGEAALEALARVYEAAGRRSDTAEVLEWLCAQSSREALGARALRLAGAYVAIGQPQRARARLEQAAVTALEAGPVRRRLGGLYREARDWERLVELLATEAARAPDVQTRVSLLCEAAGLHRTERKDPGSAVELLRQAVELSPDDASVRLELSEALKEAQRYDEAIEILRAQIARYGSRRPKDRALVHFQVAKVSLAAGRREEALAELAAANKIDPAHPGILQASARLAFEAGQLQRAEKTFRALLLVLKPGEPDESASRAEALLDLSEIAVVQEDPVRATEFVESAFEAALESEHEALALERALKARGRTELLARALEARLEHASQPSDAARALADLVMLHAAHLAAGQQPTEAWRQRADRICEQLETAEAPDDDAWAALGQVYDCLGDADAEAAILERRVASWVQRDSAPPNAEPFYRLAEVRLAGPVTRAEGLSLLERALSIQPDAERAERLLRGLLESEPMNEHILRLLEGLARSSGRERMLADVLSLIVRLPGSHSEAIHEGVSLAKRLQEPQLLEQMLQGALGSELVDEDAVWVRCELAELREQAGHGQMALELREQAASFATAEQARSLRLAVAQAATAKFEDFARAARMYEQLLEADGADQEAWEPLLDVYRTLRDKDRLVRLIDQTAPLVESAAGRSRLRLEQADILLEQGETDEAAETLHEIVVEDPSQVKAAALLSGILEKQGRTEQLAALLTMQLDAAKDRRDTEAIVSMSERLVALLEAEARVDEALDVSHSVLEWVPDSEKALRSILRLSELKADQFLVADALEALLRVVTGNEAAELAARLIGLRKELEDPAGVERAVELGFEACPTNTSLRDGLIALRRKRQDWAGVAEVLSRALEAAPDDAELVVQLIDAYRSAGEPERALGVLEDIIEQDPDNAALYRQRAALFSDLDREEEALAELERAYQRSGEYASDLMAALERAIVRAEGRQERELTLRLVQILDSCGDSAGMRARLVYLVESDPNDRESLRRLAELEVAANNWEAATAAYVQLVPLEAEERLVEVALKLADAADRAGQAEDARDALERAQSVAPDNVAVRERLRNLYEALGETRELAHMLAQEAAAETDPAKCSEHLLQAGELLLVAPDAEPSEAVRVLEQAHSLGLEELHGVVLLARAYAAAGRGDDAMDVLGATASEYQGKRIKEMSEVYQEMARLQLEEGFLTDALESLTKAFDMDLRNGVLGMQLGELALDMEEWEAASRAFRQVSMMKPYSLEREEGATQEQKADAQYYLAWLAKQAGDTRKAKILVSKALTANAEHEQARALLAELEGK